MMIDRGPEPDIAPTRRRVDSWATGRHVPRPVFRQGRWCCRDCTLLLTRYRYRARVRLRHHPRGKSIGWSS
jgi:hypothetical protein